MNTLLRGLAYCLWTTRLLRVGLLVLVLPVHAASAAEQPAAVAWQPFTAQAFEQARAENKLVLLNLVAVWCHWCHVMDARTYVDPQVAAYIHTHFIPVQADHDARPDLAERYRDWGWPATVVLDADGNDILKRAGFIDRDAMLRMLRAVIEDPTPEADDLLAVPQQLPELPRLSAVLAARLQQRHRSAYDTQNAGIDLAMKFVDQDSLLWALRKSAEGDDEERRRVMQTLDAARALIDPAFGGAYQYSTHGDWAHPHYEKIMKTQWANLLVYSRACQQLDRPDYCDAARRIAAYFDEFLRDAGGAFYSSQDADLRQGEKAHDYFALDRKARLALGVPRVDRAVYAATNGMAIEALVELHLATRDARYLAMARQAYDWIVARRSLPGGGFKHGERDSGGPFLADTLWMGRAAFALYRAQGKPADLQRAQAAAGYIDQHFRHPRAGVLPVSAATAALQPLPQIDQNIQTALWLADVCAAPNGVAACTLADHVMRYLATPEIANARLTEAGILEADARLRANAQRSDTNVNRP